LENNLYYYSHFNGWLFPLPPYFNFPNLAMRKQKLLKEKNLLERKIIALQNGKFALIKKWVEM
jgi:hypothetical protein